MTIAARRTRRFPYLRSSLSRVSLTVALPALALLLNEWLLALLQPTFEPPFTAGVAIVSWLAGPIYGAASLALSAALLLYFLLTPYYGSGLFEPSTILRFCFFLATNTVIVGLIANLYRTQAQLATSDRMYRNLSELIPFGGWVADAEGQMLHVSDSFLNGFGVTLDQCRGLGWTLLIEESQREEVISEWKRCLSTGYFWDYEYRMKGRNGETCIVLSRGVPVVDAAGRKLSWVGIHLDVTDRERYAEDRIRQARDIARLNAELEQLAYISAHDLQEPLRMIASYLQLLERRYGDRLDGEAHQFIAYAVEGATRLKSLLQDLLLLQNIGKNPERRASHSLQDIVEKAKERLGSVASGVAIHCGPLPFVYCDQAEFVQLFEHLLDNAIKYSRPDVPCRISIVAEAAPEGIAVCVRDNGIGIDAEYLHRIFRIFQRLHSRAKYPGTGIGLAICRKIVEVHGGRIWAESTPGQGSAFWFTVPDAGQIG